MWKSTMFYRVPYQAHVRTLDEFGKCGQLTVHVFQLRTNREHQFDALFFVHLLIDAHLTDGVDDAKTLVDDAHIDVITLVVERNGNGIGRRITNLRRKPPPVLAEVVDLIVEAVGLCGIRDDIAERTQVVIKLLLETLGFTDLLVQPYMSLCLHGHRLQLVFVLRLGLVGVFDNHTRQDRIHLGMGYTGKNPYQ